MSFVSCATDSDGAAENLKQPHVIHACARMVAVLALVLVCNTTRCVIVYLDHFVGVDFWLKVGARACGRGATVSF